MSQSVDVSDLESALEGADLRILLMVLIHLTGDERWLEERYRPEVDHRVIADESAGLPSDVQIEVRAAAAQALACGENGSVALSRDLLRRMMNFFVGEPVPNEYLSYLLTVLGTAPLESIETVPEPDWEGLVVIVGAGVSGISMAVELETLGVDYVILEKNQDVGGTWFENRYPEAGVDTPNHFYSFSFAAHKWSRYFAKAPELQEYLRKIVERYGILDKIRFGVTAERMVYDEGAHCWTTSVLTEKGARETVESDLLIVAVGPVNRPKLPDVSGMDQFTGRLVHSARWPEDLDLTGKRVALVGTGATAVQAARTMADDAAHLTVFQRSPQWLTPIPDYHREVTPQVQLLLDYIPFYADWYRFGLFWRYSDGLHKALTVDPEWKHQERAVNATNDRQRAFLTRYMESRLQGRPDLIEKCLPDYPPYGKRMIIDNDWFDTLRRPDVTLVTDAVTGLSADTIITSQGEHHQVDVVVFATGFQATEMLSGVEIVGPAGVPLVDAWNGDEPITYLGMATPGYPNLFMVLGPTTALAHGGSVIFMVEAQTRYLVQCIKRMADHGWREISCTEEAALEYTESVEREHRKLVFSSSRMNNWYKNSAGRVVTVTPFRLIDYWHMTREPDFNAFRCD